MNRILFILTTVTACSVPFTILSGYWGMNFDDMTELQVETGGFGIRLFWVTLCSLLAVVFMTFYRAGFAAAFT